MIEIFKDIEGYEGYQISNYGRVKSLNYNRTGKEKILKPTKDKKNYLRVDLSKQGKRKQYQIHRLVAQAFLDNPNNYEQINHKNEIKTDNRVENLEWCTPKQNNNYGTRNKRIAESKSKQVMCVETGVIYISTNEVQRQLNLKQGDISRCCNGKRKTCGGFHWCYV